MQKIRLLLFVIIVLTFSFLSRGATNADGTYANLGTSDAADGSADAINFSQGRVWTIDQYGKYIWLTQTRNSGVTHWTWSNDNGANWNQGSENYSFLIRASVAYDSINDKLHVIWAATDSNDGIIYRRYGITRDGSNNITAIAREDSANVNLQLDTSAGRTLAQPIALWVNDGSADGILVAIWSKHGSSLNEVRASMRRLSISAADGVAGNWIPLDGSADTFSTDPPAVAGDKIFGDTSGTNHASAIVRGGTGTYKDDLYVFVAETDTSTSDSILAYRADWNSASSNWSDGWQSPVTLGAFDTSLGYSLKDQLITKPVLDTTNDRLYVGWARWKDVTNGDTASMAYLSSTNSASSTIDLYSALGTHSYAPTLDIAYDATQDLVYGSYLLSTTNGDNGSIQYKSYDGSSLSSATTFYTTPGGSSGANGSADIPILYESRNNNRLLFAFRKNGALPPTGVDPHTIFWGYISLPSQPTVQFTSTSSSGSEGTTSVNLEVSTSGTFTRDVTVNYAVTGGTATGSGTDYTLSSGTATITAGSTTTNIPVTVVNDSSVESSETIIVTLSSPVFASLGSNTSHTYTIIDNDTSSSSSSSTSNSSTDVSAPSCDVAKPDKAPWLYAASPEDTNAVKLFFSDDSSNVDSYVLEYGTQSNKYDYSATNIGGKGTRTYTVKELASNTNYYFRVRNNNNCATGNWSSEITTKTKSSQQNSLELVTTIEKSETSTLKPTVPPSVTVPTASVKPTPVAAVGGYDVQVKVVDEDKKPVENAKVTLHSTPRTALTDKSGIAQFKNVEKGQHKLQIAYDNYEGEQGLTVEGDTKNINLNIEIKKKSDTGTNAIYLIAGLVIGGIIMVIFAKKILHHKN
jgi:hypothetical protein